MKFTTAIELIQLGYDVTTPDLDPEFLYWDSSTSCVRVDEPWRKHHKPWWPTSDDLNRVDYYLFDWEVYKD